MKTACSALTALIFTLCLVVSVWADADPTKTPEQLGRVLFKTSCSPDAQKQFERALAMLHSFFFPETIKTFSAVLETDPSCAIAYWGIAISQRPNPLVPPFDAATLKRVQGEGPVFVGSHRKPEAVKVNLSEGDCDDQETDP